MNKDNESLVHTKWRGKYHIVFAPIFGFRKSSLEFVRYHIRCLEKIKREIDISMRWFSYLRVLPS